MGVGGWSCFCCGGPSGAGGGGVRLPEPFQLPASLPAWPQGLGPFLSSFSLLVSLFVVLANWFLNQLVNRPYI